MQAIAKTDSQTTGKSLTKPESTKLSDLCASSAARLTQTSEADVLGVMEGARNPMRAMPADEVEAAITVEVALIAKEYGSRERLEGNVLSECVLIVMQRFGHLGIAEMRQAYRMWASGELKGGQEMWGGAFNARQLGSVLAAYDGRRAEIYNAWRTEENAYQRDRARVLREQERRDAYDAQFAEMVEEIEAKCRTWEDVPHYLWTQMVDRGMVELGRDEISEIWNEARELAAVEIRRDTQAANTTARVIKSVKREIEERHHSRSQVIAGKIAVFRHVFSKLKKQEA